MVSLIAIVPDSECSTPILIVSLPGVLGFRLIDGAAEDGERDRGG